MSISESRVVSKQFASDFELVAGHYELKKHGEYETAKQVARNDLPNAEICFLELAKQIREAA